MSSPQISRHSLPYVRPDTPHTGPPSSLQRHTTAEWACSSRGVRLMAHSCAQGGRAEEGGVLKDGWMVHSIEGG